MHDSPLFRVACTAPLMAVVMTLASCDYYHGTSRRYRGDSWEPSYSRDPCARYESCTTCTPVLGCGWCTTPEGAACFSSPLDCADADQFSWTWETRGCPPAPESNTDAGNDASVAPATDAGL